MFRGVSPLEGVKMASDARKRPQKADKAVSMHD